MKQDEIPGNETFFQIKEEEKQSDSYKEY